MKSLNVIGYWLGELFTEKTVEFEVTRYDEITGKPYLIKQWKKILYFGEFDIKYTCRECVEKFFGEDTMGPFVYGKLKCFDFYDVYKKDGGYLTCFVGCEPWDGIKCHKVKFDPHVSAFKVIPNEIDLRSVSEVIHNETLQWLKALVPDLPADYELPQPSFYVVRSDV